MVEQPGSSKDSNLSGQHDGEHSFEAALEEYPAMTCQDPQDPNPGSLFEEDPDIPGIPDILGASWQGGDAGSFLEEDHVLEALAEEYHHTQFARSGCTAIDAATADGVGSADGVVGGRLAVLQRTVHVNVLRAAEPLSLPRPISVRFYGGTKRVQRMLAPLTAAERQSSCALARQAPALNEFSPRRRPVPGEAPPVKHPDRSRYASAEIMALFAISAGAAEHLITDAELLIRDLPDTLAHYCDGSLDARRVKAIIRGCENTPSKILHELETSFLSFAMSTNPNALTRRVRATAERHNPEPLEERHKRARTSREVWLTPLPDGMAQLDAPLPATDATLLFNTLDGWARAAKQQGEDSHGTTSTGRPSRSLAEYRADILTDLLHQILLHPTTTDAQDNGAGGPFFKQRVPVNLNITVTAERLLGKTGRITSIGRKSRKPPQAMAREVRQRDQRCTGIGCDRPAESCELDHTRPYNKLIPDGHGGYLPPGETSLENLRPRCPACHHLKDHPNTIKTTTPTGRIYLQTHDDTEPPF